MSAEIIDMHERSHDAWDAYMHAKERFDASPTWQNAGLCGRAWLNLMNSFCPPDRRVPHGDVIEFPRNAL